LEDGLAAVGSAAATTTLALPLLQPVDQTLSLVFDPKAACVQQSKLNTVQHV